MGARLILVVDPEAAVRQTVIDVLSLDEHEVDGAGDAESALLLLDQRRYDLVISDLHMPGLDGPALYGALASRFGDTPPRVMFLTSGTFEPHYGSFLANMRTPALTKPLKTGRMLDLVRRVLES
ncbi:MAG TPA: response regulator [Methylomirabilota bacterium]